MTNERYAVLLIAAILGFPALALADGGGKRAVTNWLVFFNDPTACATAPCTDADLFVPGNPAQVAICYLTGQVVYGKRKATFAGRFAEGTNYGCFYPGSISPYGLEDADGTEVHVVAQEHGKALKSGRGLEEQVAYFQGGCNPGCEDTQFAIHSARSSDAVEVFRFSDGSQVSNAVSTIFREGDGIRVIFHTRFEKAHRREDDDD